MTQHDDGAHAHARPAAGGVVAGPGHEPQVGLGGRRLEVPTITRTGDGQTVERLLVVMAHPDDVDFGAAGTVAAHTEAGVEVAYCIVTDGDNGGFDPDVPREQIPGIRQAEQRAAAKEVGVQEVHFLGYPDGQVPSTSMDLRRDISRVIRKVRPQRVVTQSPEFTWSSLPTSHPDHRATGLAAVTAVYPDARNPFAHPQLLADEGLRDWKVAETWLGGHRERSHYVDVTDVFDRKVSALRRHESQLAGVPGDLEGLLRGWLGRWAEEGGLAEGRLAEAFYVVPSA